jgi:transcriptional regulator with XRE-family HTH domain
MSPDDTEFPLNFGPLLRRQRSLRGLRQLDLARRSGLSRKAISNLESGKFEPSWRSVVLLARTLGIGVQEFWPWQAAALDAVCNL